ncbi:hypothetical protein ACQKNX_22160 [Lysinibacillus sp. NPDC093712]|uniref:hypothetical protein n=1 Tax=Lysinibacillus sp. NPDC093712 TaxID=3390579 RepID=UPI003D053B4B
MEDETGRVLARVTAYTVPAESAMDFYDIGADIMPSAHAKVSGTQTILTLHFKTTK